MSCVVPGPGTGQVSFFVAGEPAPGPRPRVTSRGTFYTPRYYAWRDLVAWTAKEHCLAPLEGGVVMALRFYLSGGRRRDLDNLLRGVFDGCEGIIYADDAQVIRLVAAKFPAEGRPGMRVDVWDADGFEVAVTEALMALIEKLLEQGPEEGPAACPECRGTGWVETMETPVIRSLVPCPTCVGAGRAIPPRP